MADPIEHFEWRSGWTPKGVSVDVAVAELERLHATAGNLTAETVFHSAQAEDSPLHPAFVWDGDAAVEQLGLQMARVMVRSVRVVIVQPDGQRESWPKYVGVPEERTGPGRVHISYRDILQVRQDDAARSAAIGHLTAELQQAQRALDEVKQFFGTGDANIARLIALSEALATAHELARYLH